MANISIPLVLILGQSYTGLGSSINYSILDGAGNAVTSGTTMTEQVDAASSANTGNYYKVVTVADTTLAPLLVLYTVTGQGGIAAIERIESLGVAQNVVSLASLTTLCTMISQICGKNNGQRNITRNAQGNILTFDLCTYDTSGHATTNDGSTGLVNKFSTTITYDTSGTQPTAISCIQTV